MRTRAPRVAARRELIGEFHVLGELIVAAGKATDRMSAAEIDRRSGGRPHIWFSAVRHLVVDATSAEYETARVWRPSLAQRLAPTRYARFTNPGARASTGVRACRHRQSNGLGTSL